MTDRECCSENCKLCDTGAGPCPGCDEGCPCTLPETALD